MAEHDLQSIAFPTLDEAQIARLSSCTAAVSRSYKDGQTLFAVGDRDIKFFVVKSGAVEIVDYSGDEPKRVTVHHPGQFVCRATQPELQHHRRCGRAAVRRGAGQRAGERHPRRRLRAVRAADWRGRE